MVPDRLAEVLSNSIVREDEIQFGRQIPWHVDALQTGRLRLAELIALDGRSPHYTGGATRERFDAQAWGVMHYMLFGQEEQGSVRVNALAQLLLEGRSSTDAVSEVFGSVDALEQAYLQYQKKPISNFARLRTQSNAISKDFPARSISASDALATRAGLHVAMNRLDDARVLIAESRKTEAANASSYDVEALLFDCNRQGGEARAAYAKAVELNSQSIYTHYRAASSTPNAPPVVRPQASTNRFAAPLRSTWRTRRRIRCSRISCSTAIRPQTLWSRLSRPCDWISATHIRA